MASREFNDNGSNYLDTNEVSTYNFVNTDHHTCLAWIYADNLTTAQQPLGNYDGGSGGGWSLQINATSGAVRAVYLNNGGTDAPTAAITAGQWWGVGITWDGGNEHQFVTISPAGVVLSESVAASNVLLSSSAGLDIGTAGSGLGPHEGALAHAQVFDRLLSPNEMQNALWNPGSVSNGLVGYWPLRGKGSSEPDLSKTGADASVVGSVPERLTNPPVSGNG